MQEIIYAGAIGEADTATSVHTYRMAKLMKSIGYRVSFCCTYPAKGYPMKKQDFSYAFTSPYPGKGRVKSFHWMTEQFFGISLYNLLYEQLSSHDVAAVILYDSISIILQSRLLCLCKKKHIPLIIEVSEWGEVRDYHKLWNRFDLFQKDIRKKYFDKKAGNIVAISAFLTRHYQEQGCNVFCIPPIFFDEDFTQGPNRRRENEAISLIFAGTLSEKDYLLPLLEALKIINQNEVRIKLKVIGPDRKQLEELFPQIDMLKKSVALLGHLSHEQVRKHLETADFSVLLRKNKRYAKAGVSTKFTEAMCMGVPSICTRVDGTDRYVDDGIDGIIISDNARETLVSALERILLMSDDEILCMKRNAIEKAHREFYYQRYQDTFSKYILTLRH